MGSDDSVSRWQSHVRNLLNCISQGFKMRIYFTNKHALAIYNNVYIYLLNKLNS